MSDPWKDIRTRNEWVTNRHFMAIEDRGRLLADADALLILVQKAEELVDMAGYADNSGGEYQPTCQGCSELNYHRPDQHHPDCPVAAWRMRLLGLRDDLRRAVQKQASA